MCKCKRCESDVRNSDAFVTIPQSDDSTHYYHVECYLEEFKEEL